MLCDTIQELILVMREDSKGAKTVECSDYKDLSWIGFTIHYGGGSVTHNATIEAMQKWKGCPHVGRMLSSPTGRRAMAKAFRTGRPFHEDCSHCLAYEVMES